MGLRRCRWESATAVEWMRNEDMSYDTLAIDTELNYDGMAYST
jgi:hypothetical protein